MNTASSLSDSELLQQYEQSEDQLAFKTLVERYQTMVLGAAFRRTGNTELAREVAQEVFATLAKKARFLLGRSSVGGWLHQAAVYQSVRVYQSETRRRLRNERFSEEAPALILPTVEGQSRSEPLAVVDETLDELAASDREVLVLHYFQDLSYPEMSQILGINEAAVRQRVSRALDRLGKNLRERGIGGNTVVILVSAVAIQSTLAAPAGLASAALATAAAGSAGVTLAALLSHGSVRVAAVLMALAGSSVIWNSLPDKPVSNSGDDGTVAQAFAIGGATEAAKQQGASTTTPLDQLSTASIPPGTEFQGNSSTVASLQRRAQNLIGIPNVNIGSGGFSTVAGNPPSSSSSSTSASRAPAAPPLPPPVSRTQQPRKDPQSSNPPASDKGGPVDTPATDTPLEPPITSPRDPGFQFPGLLGEIADLGGLPAVIDELLQSELVPRRAAELYGELLEDVLSLEPLQRIRVEGILEDHYERLNQEGIAGLQPAEIAELDLRKLRETRVREVVNDLQEEIADVLPDPKIVDDVLSLVDRPVSEPGAPKSPALVPTVLDTVETVLPKVTGDKGLLGLPLLR